MSYRHWNVITHPLHEKKSFFFFGCPPSLNLLSFPWKVIGGRSTPVSDLAVVRDVETFDNNIEVNGPWRRLTTLSQSLSVKGYHRHTLVDVKTWSSKSKETSDYTQLVFFSTSVSTEVWVRRYDGSRRTQSPSSLDSVNDGIINESPQRHREIMRLCLQSKVLCGYVTGDPKLQQKIRVSLPFP